MRCAGEIALGIDPLASAHEHELTSALSARGFPVPEPLGFAQTGPCAPYTLTALIPGVPATGRQQANLPELLADVLARLHGARLPRFAWLRDAREVMHERVLWPERTHDPSVDHDALLEQYHERWEEMTPPAHEVVLHGDPWPGNLLVDGEDASEVAALIDWEDACFGDPVMDVAIASLELHLLFGAAFSQRFVSAYEYARDLGGAIVDLDALSTWCLAAACRPMGSFDDWALGFIEMGRPDLTAPLLRSRFAEFARLFARLSS